MELPESEGQSDVKVLESINVCYFSNFDLNINDWFIEYENIEIFKLNMKKNLGTIYSHLLLLGSTWLTFINEAMEIDC